ncbi:MAG TPA: hypothetical protein VI997_10280 [Candidatus Thermoplasmatota archaeon]|nr:hypothetical protein [Candidatus Thermoplasmatota archaeon]
MLIREAPTRTADKELKVKLPMRLHVKLHTLKMLKGVQICAVVEEALDRYFDDLRAEHAGVTFEGKSPV